MRNFFVRRRLNRLKRALEKAENQGREEYLVKRFPLFVSVDISPSFSNTHCTIETIGGFTFYGRGYSAAKDAALKAIDKLLKHECNHN